MSAVFMAFDYIFGLAVFGFLRWILHGIQIEFQDVSQTGTTFDWAIYMWNAAIIIYLVFGPFWFFRVLKEWKIEQQRGGGFF